MGECIGLKVTWPISNRINAPTDSPSDFHFGLLSNANDYRCSVTSEKRDSEGLQPW